MVSGALSATAGGVMEMQGLHVLRPDSLGQVRDTHATLMMQDGKNAFPLGITTRLNSYFGIESGPMLLSNFTCYGAESSLLDCTYSIPFSSCDRYDIAGVTCEGNDHIYHVCDQFSHVSDQFCHIFMLSSMLCQYFIVATTFIWSKLRFEWCCPIVHEQYQISCL